MIAKLASPLGSPTLAATTAQFRNRLPYQFRRYLPYYAAAVVLFIFFFNVNLFSSTDTTTPQIHRNHYSGVVQQPKAIRAEFPRKIWQTWKVNSLKFEKKDHDRALSWTEKNPDWRYETLTDDNDIKYVEWHFGPDGFNRPDIVDFYRGVKDAIVKADVLRYLIMYAEGGLYADIDVEALRPLSKFIPDRYDVADVDMVIGVEIDEPDWKDHPILGPKSRSFCQWTFMCKPQLPVMMKLIEGIMDWLNAEVEKQGTTLAEVKLDFDQIISGTGPSAFTNAIIDDMNERRMRTDPTSPVIDWDMFHDMQESRLVSGVLVLTVEAFAAGQGHSDSGNHDARAALVKHHYHASNWPSRHPRFRHPAYLEVEQCNWVDECINKWDKNVAAFEKMSPEEQKKIIAQKEKERKEKAEKEKKKKEEAERKKKEEAEAKKKAEEEAARKKKEEEEEKAAAGGQEKTTPPEGEKPAEGEKAQVPQADKPREDDKAT